MIRILLTAASLFAAAPALAHSVTANPNQAVTASFDIIETSIALQGDAAVFTTRVRGEAGRDKPDATGKFEGASVYAYVWPTSLDSADIGFEAGQGIVAVECAAGDWQTRRYLSLIDDPAAQRLNRRP